MKKIVLLFSLLAAILVFTACDSDRKKCVRACAQAAIDDLGACTKMEDKSKTQQCTSDAKKKGRDCLAACPAE